MGNREVTFQNFIPNFSISGKYCIEKGNIIFTELDLDAQTQMGTTRLDFTPKWLVKTRKGKTKLILELTPKLVEKVE